MVSFSMNDKLILLQYAIEKYDSEDMLKEKLKDALSPNEIERGIDILIGTQRLRRIGANVLQNNVSHTGELPELPESMKSIVENL
jgi:hypothetical protein